MVPLEVAILEEDLVMDLLYGVVCNLEFLSNGIASENPLESNSLLISIVEVVDPQSRLSHIASSFQACSPHFVLFQIINVNCKFVAAYAYSLVPENLHSNSLHHYSSYSYNFYCSNY